MATWDTDETVDARVESLLGYIRSNRVRATDRAADTIEDDRAELDLFVFDRYDHFVDA